MVGGVGVTQCARSVAPEDAAPSVSCGAETVRKHAPMMTVVPSGGAFMRGGAVGVL